MIQRCRGLFHEFGWLIHLAVTLITLAAFVGALNQKVENVDKRVDKIEHVLTCKFEGVCQ